MRKYKVQVLRLHRVYGISQKLSKLAKYAVILKSKLLGEDGVLQIIKILIPL